jgi:hypothetical protein
LLGLFALPSVEYEPYIEQVHYIEPTEENLEPAKRLIERYNREGKPWYSSRHGYRLGYGGENFGGVSGVFARHQNDQQAPPPSEQQQTGNCSANSHQQPAVTATATTNNGNNEIVLSLLLSFSI